MSELRPITPDLDDHAVVDPLRIPSDPEDDDTEETNLVLRVGVPILAVVIATAVLYFARDILLPLAMATMLSVIFSPLARRAEMVIGRLAGTALVVIGAIAMVGAIGYYLTTELTSVADDLTSYSSNIADKLTALRNKSPAGLQRIQRAIEDVQKQVQRSSPTTPAKPRTVQATFQTSLGDNLKPFVPVLSGLVDFLLIVVLLFFLLYSRSDLRDRVVRLAARARISVASQAIETAGQTVSRYLIPLFADQFRIRPIHRPRMLDDRLADARAMGLARFPVSIRSIRRCVDGGAAANLGRVRGVPRLGQVDRSPGRLYRVRSGRRAIYRTLHGRPRHRNLAGRVAGVGHVLVVDMGTGGAAAGDATHSVHQGGGRLHSRVQFFLHPARLRASDRGLSRILSQDAGARSRGRAHDGRAVFRRAWLRRRPSTK